MNSSSGVQSEVRRVIHQGISCIVKSPRRGALRPLHRWALGREGRVYQKLGGIEGIPRCLGMTADGLVLEAVEGRALSEFRRGEISVEFLDGLDRIIADIHARGVVHSDLKKRDNILVLQNPESRIQNPEEGRNQRPVIVDFGAAFVEGEWLYETFRRVDLAAAAKLRAHHQPETLRPEQRQLLDHPTWAERLSRLLIHTVRDPFRRMWS